MRSVSRWVILVGVFCTVPHRTPRMSCPRHIHAVRSFVLFYVSATVQQHVSITHGCSLRGMVSYDSIDRKDTGYYCVPRCTSTYLAKAFHPRQYIEPLLFTPPATPLHSCFCSSSVPMLFFQTPPFSIPPLLRPVTCLPRP